MPESDVNGTFNSKQWEVLELASDGKENDWNLPIDKKRFPPAHKKRFIIWLLRKKSMQIKISFTLFIYAFTSHVNSKQQVAEVLLFNSQFHLFTIFAAEF